MTAAEVGISQVSQHIAGARPGQHQHAAIVTDIADVDLFARQQRLLQVVQSRNSAAAAESR